MWVDTGGTRRGEARRGEERRGEERIFEFGVGGRFGEMGEERWREILGWIGGRAVFWAMGEYFLRGGYIGLDGG